MELLTAGFIGNFSGILQARHPTQTADLEIHNFGPKDIESNAAQAL